MIQYKDAELFAAYREFLGLSKSQLAREMATTPTSISRWESGIEPITGRTMVHLKLLVTKKVHDQMGRVFAQLLPKLRLSTFVDLFGIPHAEVVEDRHGQKYVGTITIGGYHDHSLTFSLKDGQLYAMGRDHSAVPVTNEFLQELVKKNTQKNV